MCSCPLLDGRRTNLFTFASSSHYTQLG
nr:TPA_asm: m12 uoORF [Murid betaherpesvirus 1]DBA07716.1 TPA_asm: m12 uoORF [Murid betaherpesvirus 1]